MEALTQGMLVVRQGTQVVHMVMSMVVDLGECMTAEALPVADPNIMQLAICFLVFVLHYLGVFRTHKK